MTWSIDVLDLQVTLRCNASCSNCIKLCNMQALTGIDDRDSDLTLDQVREFVRQAKAASVRIDQLFLTGGEPLLHPDLETILDLCVTSLVRPGQVRAIAINSNLLIAAPDPLKRFIVNFSRPADNPHVHHAVLLHPDDTGQPRPSFRACTHYRKNRVVLNYHGYSLCCAADGYIRLFCFDHLIINQFPRSLGDFPLSRMDDVCQHCPFGSTPRLQRDVGRPISEIYAVECAANRAGRHLRKRLGE